MVLQINSTKLSRKGYPPVFFKLFQNTEDTGIHQSSFCEANITLIPKQTGTKQKGRKGRREGERDYRPISLMHIGAKILNKILANQIQQ